MDLRVSESNPDSISLFLRGDTHEIDLSTASSYVGQTSCTAPSILTMSGLTKIFPSPLTVIFLSMIGPMFMDT